MESNDLERIELDLLVEAIHKRYGYDFRQYARRLAQAPGEKPPRQKQPGKYF